ncbi:MAG TPA: hypothetical protein PLI09_09025 [Candidatus Hydrogenedentes bacterium]|nr:hypothetical protein [Candidatus Hydrogenedentota bacterium]
MNSPIGETLCTKCKWAAGCTFPSESGEPILSCESFERLQGLTRKRTASLASINPSRINGLCGDCGNRETCVFRQREGGTWHCEEYRLDG